MANILDYFESKPNVVGVSTFNKLNENTTESPLIKADDSVISGYQTLIGALGKSADDWQNDYQKGGKGNTTPSLLLHAAEIFWGNVQFKDKAQENLEKIDLLKEGRIRTSRDIIAVLEYLLEHMNDGPVLIPALTLDPNTKISLTDVKLSSPIKGLLNNTNESANGITWTVTTKTKSNCGDFTLSPTTGASVTLTAPVKTGTPNPVTKGTFELGSWSTNTTSGTATISAGNVSGASNGAAKEAKATASITAALSSIGLQASVDAEYIGSIAGDTLGADNWSWALAPGKTTKSGITPNFNGKTLTLTNTSTAAITVEAGTYICTNKNRATSEIGNPVVTVPVASSNAPYITVSPTSISLTATKTSQEFTATAHNDAAVNNVQWTIDDTTNFSISSDSGSKTTVSLKKEPATGTVTMSASGNNTTSVTLTGGFTEGSKLSVTGKKLTATLTGCSPVTATVSCDVAAKSAGTYTWTWTSLPAGLTCNQSSGYKGTSITITNSTYADVSLPANTITVINENGGSTSAKNTALTVKGLTKTITISPNSTQTIANGDTKQFTATTKPDSETVKWTVGDGLTITQDNGKTITIKGTNTTSSNKSTSVKVELTSNSSISASCGVTITGVAKEYYWYVGQDDPSKMTSLSPIRTDNTTPGWMKIGTTLPETLGGAKVKGGVSGKTWYFALPKDGNYSGATTDFSMKDGTIILTGQTVTINGIVYSIFTNDLTTSGFNACFKRF